LGEGEKKKSLAADHGGGLSRPNRKEGRTSGKKKKKKTFENLKQDKRVLGLLEGNEQGPDSGKKNFLKKPITGHV